MTDEVTQCRQHEQHMQCSSVYRITKTLFLFSETELQVICKTTETRLKRVKLWFQVWKLSAVDVIFTINEK